MTVGRRFPRRIDYSERAQVELERKADRYERLWDVFSNLEWHLRHTPDHPLAERVGETDYFVIESQGFPISTGKGIPGLRLLYRFDDGAVYVRDVLVTPPPGE